MMSSPLPLLLPAVPVRSVADAEEDAAEDKAKAKPTRRRIPLKRWRYTAVVGVSL